MRNYLGKNVLLPAAAELAYRGYRKYVRPTLKKSWDYNALSAPLILSQKNNQMAPYSNARRAARTNSGARGRQMSRSTSSNRSSSMSISPNPRSLSSLRPGRSRGKAFTTPGKTRINRVRFGSNSSKSAGFYKRKKYRPRKRDKIGAAGVNYTRELYKTETTTNQVLWIGHNTAPFSDLKANLIRALLKLLMDATKGAPVLKWTDVVTGISINDIIVFRYIQGVTPSVVTYACLGTETWNDIVSFFFVNAILWNSDTTQLLSLNYLPVTNAVGSGVDRSAVRVDLENARVTGSLKSTMKMQNRSFFGADATGDTTEDLDSVPLYGKQYSGKGNGVVVRPTDSTGLARTLIAANTTGYILGSSTDAGQDEPIAPVYFKGCSKYGKVHLDPAQIKTNVLIHNFSMSLNQMRKFLTDDSLSVNTKSSFGKYSIFSYEQMIRAPSATNSTISIAFEINHHITMKVTPGKRRAMTFPYFEATDL